MKAIRIHWLCAAALASLTAFATGCDKGGEPQDKDDDEQKTPTSLNIDYDGDMQQIEMGIAGDWRAESDQPWCQPVITSGSGVGKVGLNIAYNTTAEERKATITISSGAGSAKAFDTRAGGGYTVEVTQKPNTLETPPPAFTEAKFEDQMVFYKLWTGPGGTISDPLDETKESYLSNMWYYAHAGMEINKSAPAKQNTNWSSFYKFNITGDEIVGLLKIGDLLTANKIVLDQTETFSKYADSPVKGTGEVNFVLGNKLYYGGGIISGNSQRDPLGSGNGSSSYERSYDFYAFDPAAGTQTKLKDLPFSSGYATVMDGKPYALFSDMNIYRYEVASDSWTKLGAVATNQSPAAFYAVGSRLFIADGSARYQYRLGGDGKPVTDSIAATDYMYVDRVCNDGEGRVWLVNGNAAYLHTPTGYDYVSCYTDVLGAYKGRLYGYKTNHDNTVHLLKADGQKDSVIPGLLVIPSCGGAILNGRWLAYYPDKFSAVVGGRMVLFGGYGMGYDGTLYTTKFYSSQTMYSLNLANPKEPRLLLVTTK